MQSGKNCLTFFSEPLIKGSGLKMGHNGGGRKMPCDHYLLKIGENLGGSCKN